MEEISESPSQDGVRSRGNVLALLGGAIAGAVAGALGRPGQALGGHDATNVFHLGEDNFAPVGSGTALTGDVDGFTLKIINNDSGTNSGGLEVDGQGQRAAFQANQFAEGDGYAAVFGLNKNTGIGVQGFGGTGVSGATDNGIGVSASSVNGDALVAEGGHFGVKGKGAFGGVIGESDSSFGVAGTSITDIGVGGSSQSGTGVHGRSETGFGVTGGVGQSGVGVDGHSPLGIGVRGGAEQGNGVAGECNDAQGVGTSGSSTDGIGVHALSQNGQALRVEGRAAFSTAGSGTVPQGQNSVFVSNPAVTAASHISVTLVGNPGNREVRWVERSPGSGFTLNLAPAPPNQRPATPFTYLVVEATA